MNYRNWSEFWWENITGPNCILTNITDLLVDHINVVFIVPSDLPWRYDMRLMLEERIKERNGSMELLVEFIDAEDEYPVEEKAGTFLLNKYAQSPKIRNGFRDRGELNIQGYLKKNEVLRNRIVWVKGLTGPAAQNWMDFCKGYASAGINTGIFVLEVHDVGNVTDSSNLKPIGYDENISANDIQVFNEFILNDRKRLDGLWRNYIASVSGCLCDKDAEISELLIRTTDFKSESPECGLQRIAERPEYQRRGGDENSKHILALVRRQDEGEIRHRIWTAQVKSLFPLIEFERNKFIKKHKKDIENSLRAHCIWQYKEKLEYAEDVELGTLVYIMDIENNGCRVLRISDEESEKIRLLHKCRNNIAHAKICTPEEVGKIIRYSSS